MQKPQPTPSPKKNDPHKLLVQYGAGRTTADYQKNQNIFVQGQVADTVFFIQKGRVKGCRPERGWNLVWRILRSHEGIVSGGKVNWLINGLCGKGLPTIDLAHVDLP